MYVDSWYTAIMLSGEMAGWHKGKELRKGYLKMSLTLCSSCMCGAEV